MIEVKNVKKSFPDKTVLNGIEATFHNGKTNLIIGQSGSGKTVLMKSIIGLLTPDSGQILYDGRDIVKMSLAQRKALRTEIGMLFQGSALFDNETVLGNVMFPLKMFSDMTRAQMLDRARFCLNRVNLNGAESKYPSEISGGMQKRVSLARAIATKPEIIFFDEPTTGLDPIMADVINDLIIESARGLGATALTITHDMASARKIADKIAMLYKGKIIWCGTVKEMEKTDNPYVCQFINGCSQGPIKVEV